jgi:outer membrane protein assembly factor BamB
MWPLKSKKEKYEAHFEKRFVRVRQIGFFGPFSRSQNERYSIAWSQGQDEGKGSYVLTDRDRVVLIGEIERPNDGKVGDNGTFILSDWMLGKELASRLYAFNREGDIMLNHFFQANQISSGISPDGRLAIYQTANSPSPDGNKLFLFDLETGQILWSKTPDKGWATSYDFDVLNGIVYLIYEDLSELAYNLSGEPLQEE